MTYGMSLVFFVNSGFLTDKTDAIYKWNIVESGTKHHNPNPFLITIELLMARLFSYRINTLFNNN